MGCLRLSALSAKRKHLIVLSDGAPVDDSTLMENGPTYLSDHLRQVVGDIISAEDVNIAAMGIWNKTHDFYPTSSYVESPDELGSSLIALIERLLLG